METRSRAQKPNESFQAFGMEVDGLVQLTYPGGNHSLVDNFKTKAFVNGIREPDYKLVVCSAQDNLCRDRGLRDRSHDIYTTSQQSTTNESPGGKRMPFA